MAINNNKQSNLEKIGCEARQVELVRSDYNKNDGYSETHEDALSDPENENKPLGKGTNTGGHQYVVPNASKSRYGYDYSNLDTTSGGGSYDIHGRNGVGGRRRLLAMNNYNNDNAYGHNSVDTSQNIADGQYVIK